MKSRREIVALIAVFYQDRHLIRILVLRDTVYTDSVGGAGCGWQRGIPSRSEVGIGDFGIGLEHHIGTIRQPTTKQLTILTAIRGDLTRQLMRGIGKDVTELVKGMGTGQLSGILCQFGEIEWEAGAGACIPR